MVRDHVRDRVEDATCRHERVLLRDGEVEQCGGGVLLGSVRGRVERFGYIRDCASFGDYGSGFRVLLRHEPKLAEGVDASGFGDGAELRDEGADGAALRVHGASEVGSGDEEKRKERVKSSWEGLGRNISKGVFGWWEA